MYNILICDDERDIVSALRIYLSAEGYRIFEAHTGKEALDIVAGHEIHLILMDIMMPEMDGISATARLREECNIPIILLTAKGEDTDKVLGLNVGADDYITKPFSMRELLARVRTNMRRAASMAPAAPEEPGDQIRIKDIVIDRTRRAVYKNGQELELTQREYELIKFMAEDPGRVMSREELMGSVWRTTTLATCVRWTSRCGVCAKSWRTTPPSRCTS